MARQAALLRNISTPYEEKYQTYDGNVTVTHFKRGLWSVHPRGKEPFMRGSKREAFDQAIGITARHYPKRHHSTIGESFGSTGTEAFWDLYEDELVKSVAKNPSDYALQSHETPEGYARRVRQKFQSGAQDKGLGHINLDSPTFKRLARRLGITKFSQRALKEAYAVRGGKP